MNLADALLGGINTGQAIRKYSLLLGTAQAVVLDAVFS